MFLPTTRQEMQKRGWDQADIILVSGDSYIDSSFIGVAVIGRVLLDAGFKVGVIAQPRTDSAIDIGRLGEPALFWGVSGGSVDSMVANYTPLKKRRKSDDFTPGGKNDRRPDRAVLAYANLIRQHFKPCKPIVLGGIEASLRRISHYDFWSNKVRRSILFDAKADYLLYGMAEHSIVELARSIEQGDDPSGTAGLCFIAAEPPSGYLRLDDFQVVAKDKERFAESFEVFYRNNDPLTAKGLVQKQDSRYLVQNPPAPLPSQQELDRIHELGFTNEQHPFYEQQGKVRALETIRFSITSHRGCYGECSFCAIAVHQGRTVYWRSKKSILRQARTLIDHPKFKGIILDVGGPTANMYGYECQKKLRKGPCPDKGCLFPKVCPSLPMDHSCHLDLLKELRSLPGVKRVFVASGLRYDMIEEDRRHGLTYLRELIKHHVSGQLKIAPEHTGDEILRLMGKPGPKSLISFKNRFYEITGKAGKKQFLTYYFIAAHPGCKPEDMQQLKQFCHQELKTFPEQVQIFTPTPSTYSTLMYWTGKDPVSGKKLFVEKDGGRKEAQKKILAKPDVKKESGNKHGTTKKRRFKGKR